MGQGKITRRSAIARYGVDSPVPAPIDRVRRSLIRSPQDFKDSHGRLSEMRRSILLCFLMSAARLSCSAADADPSAIAQKLFDAMAAHDGAGARALFTSDANLVSVAPDGKVTVTPIEKWTERLSSSKD